MAISITHLVKRFGSFVALDDVSLEIAAGSLTALLGPYPADEMRVAAASQAVNSPKNDGLECLEAA